MTAPALSVFQQGLGAVTADNLCTFEQTCDNFAQMRTLVGIPGIQIFARGGITIADGLQGEFYWNATATASDDGKSVIAPTAAPATGRWIRIPSVSLTYTVANLPAAPVTGQRAVVSDAASPTFLGVLVGGGTSVCPAMWNGTAWIAA